MADELARVQATVRRQDAEIARLRDELAGARVGDVLREAVGLAATAGVIASPVSHERLLELIVETAAAVIDAEAGALFLIDEAVGELFFEVATGPRAEELKRFRVPLGHGIAGIVALTGQPMAVSDASRDPRQAAEIARAVDYPPESLLCVPMFVAERIIGVLELVNKRGATSFSPADMTTLGLFARQAGVAVELSRTQARLTTVILHALEANDGASSSGAENETSLFDAHVNAEDVALRDALEAARLIREIDDYGENERRASRDLLRGFADYLRRRP